MEKETGTPTTRKAWAAVVTAVVPLAWKALADGELTSGEVAAVLGAGVAAYGFVWRVPFFRKDS